MWSKKFNTELQVVLEIDQLFPLHWDNNNAILQEKELRSHQKSKHTKRQYHIIQEIIGRGDIAM